MTDPCMLLYTTMLTPDPPPAPPATVANDAPLTELPADTATEEPELLPPDDGVYVPAPLIAVPKSGKSCVLRVG